MTGLLVSIRNEEEAAIASRFPIDIIDVKDPGQGALGAVKADVLQRIVEKINIDCEISVALGELKNYRDALPHQVLPRIHYAKIGLAGMGHIPNWQDYWVNFEKSLPATVQPVCVAYLDAESCGAPPLESVLELAKSTGSPLLVDTFDKYNGDAMTLLGIAGIQSLVESARNCGIPLVVLAGSVKPRHLVPLIGCGPGYIGVRGAVCNTGRERLDVDRLQNFLKIWQSSKKIAEAGEFS